MSPQAQKYIEKLQLKPHPEGGYYKEIYRAGEIILPKNLPKRYNHHAIFLHQYISCWKGIKFQNSTD